MRVIRIVVPLAMSLAWGAEAWAATVEVIEVEVFLRHGVGYERVPGAAQAEAGDSVMAGEFGVGQIIYANGCVITVRPGTVVRVKAEPPSSCNAAAISPANRVPTYEGLSRSRHHILLGAAIAGGAGVGIYYLTKSSGDDKPASP
ncbi:MAG: hypothetical protein ABUJ98_11210 [Hyphomicrobium sp.]